MPRSACFIASVGSDVIIIASVVTLVQSHVIVIASCCVVTTVTKVKSDVIIASLIFIQFPVGCRAVSISAALKISLDCWFGCSPIVGTARDGCE